MYVTRPASRHPAIGCRRTPRLVPAFNLSDYRSTQTMASDSEILVVGAGTIGLSIAYHPAQRGKSVCCIDPHPPPSELSAGHDLNKVRIRPP